MGRRRTRGRNLDGILVVNKAAGFTSNQTLQAVKRLFNANKAGHTGSLDKPATGVLPICFGEATKLSGFLLDSDKEYLSDCQLGVTTTTGDAAGEIISEVPVPKLTAADIESVLRQFDGDIQQVPPMHSALKHNGQRLYELAYAGKQVERAPRPVTIHALELVEQGPDRFRIRVRCSKGTYIRTLVEDIGNRIGCGAHVVSLQRTQAGPFTLETAQSVEQLREQANANPELIDQWLQPLDSAVVQLSALQLVESVVYYLKQGQAVVVPQAPTSGFVRLYDEENLFIGIGEILDDGRVAPRRMVRHATA